jgi:acetolactate synthase I/II/III large subunit
MNGRVVDAIADALAGAGIRRVYGMPGGGSNMALIDAVTMRGLQFVLAHHETGAAFMAAAEAEVTGIPGACLSTVGPGVANSINGLAHCTLDRVPLVLFTDKLEDPDTLHQVIDHGALVREVVKGSIEVEAGSGRAATLTALATALDSPPGPFHLDLSPSAGSAVESSDGTLEAPRTGPPSRDDALATAVELLRGSARPVVLVGLGARDPETVAAVRSFVERFDLPLLCTYKAKGVLPDDHPLAAGLVTNGVREGRVLEHADGLILVGFDQVELMPGPWRWPLPAVSISEGDEDGGPVHPTVRIRSAPSTGLDLLGERLARETWSVGWAPGDLPSARVTLDEVEVERAGLGVAPAEVVDIVRRLAPEGSVATVDAGSHMLPATLFWPSPSPRRFLISNGLATMGYGLPAAIGASLALPDELVVCFTGDGGLAMAAGELATAARLGVRIVVVVFNDGMLNLIKVKQEKRGETTQGLDFTPLRWAPIAQGMGLRAFEASDRDQLSTAFAEAARSDGPSLIDVRVDPSSYPSLLKLVRG